MNLTPVALTFEVSVQRASVYQWVKRFFRHHVFDTDVVAVMVTQWLDLSERWVLCLDRTNGQLGRVALALILAAMSIVTTSPSENIRLTTTPSIVNWSQTGMSPAGTMNCGRNAT